MDRLRSNRKAVDTNIPGITISPRPSIVYPLSGKNRYDFGQSILIGTSKDVATLTICCGISSGPEHDDYVQLTTSVPNTHQMSYRNNPESRIIPVLNVSSLSKDNALCAKESARMSVRKADFLLPGRYAYKIEGTSDGMKSRKDGVRIERFDKTS